MSKLVGTLVVLRAALGAAAALALAPHHDRTGSGKRLAADRYLGPLPPGAPVRFALQLRMRSAALLHYADVVGSRSAPYLTAAEIGHRFGISDGALELVDSRLARAGVQVDQSFKQRTELLVSGSAAAVERLLGVHLGRYAQPDGQRYHRPLGAATVPGNLRFAVAAATGLDTKPIPTYADVPANGVTAAELSTLYDIKALTDQGLDGSGQTVAVFSEDNFKDSDIASFDAAHGITGSPPIQRVAVDGSEPYRHGDEEVEVDLDLEIIQELAPKAQIIDYQTPVGPQGFINGIDRIVSDGKAKLVNFSYGYCELFLHPLSAVKSADLHFAPAMVSGVTVFAASGDQGAYACQRYNRADHRLTVGWPGSSPNVVSVGGTWADLRSDGTRLDELGWEDILSEGGGGGGVSALFPRRPGNPASPGSTTATRRALRAARSRTLPPTAHQGAATRSGPAGSPASSRAQAPPHRCGRRRSPSSTSWLSAS